VTEGASGSTPSGPARGSPVPGPSRAGRPFPRDILAGDTLDAARAILGALLVRDPDRAGGTRRAGRIVEVEAYVGQDDRASHARMGPTPRNRVMFGPPGIAYVYLVYGMHHCLNVVTELAPRPAALLIRAVEPVEGLDEMRVARGATRAGGRHVPDAWLAAGPGLVGLAFGLDRTATGLDLCDPGSTLRIEAAPGGEPAPPVVATPRIGIASAGEPWTSLPWRFLVPGSPSLSRQR
jgi:DNA-3-methyladenine glycosylase